MLPQAVSALAPPMGARVWLTAGATHLRTELVLDALDAAVAQRRPRDVIHHSDQGSQ